MSQQNTGFGAGAFDIRRGVLAGLVAGLVFAIVEIVGVGLVAGTPWGPPRMMASIVMGQGVLPPPASFAPGIVLVGLIVHFALSAVLGVIWGAIYRGWATPVAAAIGVAFGLAVYVVNFYGFTLVWPQFANARTPITILAHLIFGLTAALAYRRV